MLNYVHEKGNSMWHKIINVPLNFPRYKDPICTEIPQASLGQPETC